MAQLDEGFVQVTIKGNYQGKQSNVVVYYGFDLDPGSPASEAECAALAEAVVISIESGSAGEPNLGQYVALVPTTFNITAIKALVKGQFGVQLGQYEFALTDNGARTIATDELAAFTTLSCYAPAISVGQRGAKLGLSGGLEGDQDKGRWSTASGAFKDLATTWLTSMYNDNNWTPSGSTWALRPCVVPRIRTGSPGAYIYRLPDDMNDIAVPENINMWQPGFGEGTNNSRKGAIR